MAGGYIVNPTLARYALASGFFVLVLSLGVLPFLNPERPEFTPNLLAIIISSVFIVLVIYDVRKQARSEFAANR